MPARIPDDEPENNNQYGSSINNTSSFPQSNYTNNSGSSQQKNSEVEKMLAEYNIKKQEESWVRSYWRPAMGWLYMVICAFDFIIFPLIAMFLPVFAKIIGVNIPATTWVSLTLSNGGLMHMAFGAILGVAAWSRGQEKIQTIGSR